MLIHSITQAVRDTPLLELAHIKVPNGNKIYGKCEYANPAGGLKDRTGIYMIEQAQKNGILKENSVIVEATAGNTGLGLALATLHTPYRLILVIPEHFSKQKQSLIRALGAEVINTPQEQGIQGALDKADELLSQIPNALSLGQFENGDNPKAHYFHTAREIYSELNGKIDYFIAGAGSGGSFSGIARYLKEQNPSIKTMLCDPLGSHIGGFGKEDEGVCSHIEGIGNKTTPKTMDSTLVDKVLKISDAEAIEGVKMLSLKEGVLAGISSGACLMAALKLANEVYDSHIVTIFADRLERYIDERGIF